MTTIAPDHTFTAFAGTRLVASGPIETVVLSARERLLRGGAAPLLVFEDRTGATVDFDLRGSPEEVLARLPAHPLFVAAGAADAPRSGPGRPRLGVISREVSLLPRHWEWLEEQPNGISAALRRLIDEARKREPDTARMRRSRDAANRFMTVMAGDRPGFEEASRALYAGERARFESLTRPWPKDVRRHLLDLAAASFGAPAGPPAEGAAPAPTPGA